MCEKYIGVKAKSYSDKELYHAFIYEINDISYYYLELMMGGNCFIMSDNILM